MPTVRIALQLSPYVAVRPGELRRAEWSEIDFDNAVWRISAARMKASLGGVDKFEPISGGGDVDHAEEAFGKLVVAGGDGSVDFQAAEEAFDVIAFLLERSVIFDFDSAV